MHLEEKYDNRKHQNVGTSTHHPPINVPQAQFDRESSKEYEAIILAHPPRQ